MTKKTAMAVLSVTAVLLIAVIVLSCILIIQDKSGALRQKDYYDKKCNSFEVQNTNLAKGQIVFIGDSITDLYVLDEHYADLDRAVYNRGIGGDTTEGVLRRLKVSVFDIEPSAVVLMIGTNDVNGRLESDLIMSRYEETIDGIYSALPEVELYCMSIIPQNEQIEEYSNVDAKTSTEIILNLNPRIKSLAEEKGATYLDLFSLLCDGNNRLIREYSDDGLHLNGKGLSVWTALLKPYLQ